MIDDRLNCCDYQFIQVLVTLPMDMLVHNAQDQRSYLRFGHGCLDTLMRPWARYRIGTRATGSFLRIIRPSASQPCTHSIEFTTSVPRILSVRCKMDRIGCIFQWGLYLVLFILKFPLWCYLLDFRWGVVPGRSTLGLQVRGWLGSVCRGMLPPTLSVLHFSIYALRTG